MKTKIGIAALVLALSFGLSGCSGASTSAQEVTEMTTESESAAQTESETEKETIREMHVEAATEADEPKMKTYTEIPWEELCAFVESVNTSASEDAFAAMKQAVADMDGQYWNEADDYHHLNGGTRFLYAVTPDGWNVFLYDGGSYDVELSHSPDSYSSRSHVGDLWWNYVSPDTKIVGKGDLSAE